MDEVVEKFKSAKFVFIIGIGGSDLATKAVWQAISLHKNYSKKVLFLEAPDLREYEEIENLFKNEINDLNDVAVVVISKSGKTAETLETFNKIFEIVSEKFGAPIDERVLVVSTPQTLLWELAEQKGFNKIEWEKNIGGRFSAFSVAHTTPLQILGADANAFVSGSGEMKARGEVALSLAQKIWDSQKNGCDILDFFIFNSELEDLGKWCRQLIAESLATLTPTVSLGPTDLHSMLELYLGGPKTRFTIFIKSKKEIDGELNEEAFQNVTTAYEKVGLPFEKIEMPEINEFELGKFMELMMQTTVELAKLLGVDPYDQPAVEEYKKNLKNNPTPNPSP